MTGRREEEKMLLWYGQTSSFPLHVQDGGPAALGQEQRSR